MNDFYNCREVKRSRKAEGCDYCREAIEVGEPKVVETGKFDGSIWTLAYHAECFPVASAILEEANFLDRIRPDARVQFMRVGLRKQ